MKSKNLVVSIVTLVVLAILAIFSLGNQNSMSVVLGQRLTGIHGVPWRRRFLESEQAPADDQRQQSLKEE